MDHMASIFYDKILPDYCDSDNRTGNSPGFIFLVRENDGGVGLHMVPANDSPDGDTSYNGFLNPDEAEELLFALQQAITRAKSKSGRGLPHPKRVKET